MINPTESRIIELNAVLGGSLILAPQIFRERVQVQAVDDEGLGSLLERLGVLDSIGKDARCVSCGNIVTLESIAAVYPEDGAVRFICDNPKCAASMVPQVGH